MRLGRCIDGFANLNHQSSRHRSSSRAGRYHSYSNLFSLFRCSFPIFRARNDARTADPISIEEAHGSAELRAYLVELFVREETVTFGAEKPDPG